eukprot:GEZU01022065.1.p1 GENE.GEZU01022065.1~~GEZU01022065.1.p1  ORF type:complete len:170 (+),score=20.74 GEZU01022065.1:322-831(+)
MKSRKVIVLGTRAVGKSSVTIQFVENHFADSYNPTIENTFKKTIKYKGDEFTTDIVDTAGQDEFSLFQPQYSLGVDGYVMVYSVVSRPSFDMIETLNEKILNSMGVDKVPRVLVGNKIDLDLERKITSDQGKALADRLGIPFVECSAKHATNIGKFLRIHRRCHSIFSY